MPVKALTKVGCSSAISPPERHYCYPPFRNRLSIEEGFFVKITQLGLAALASVLLACASKPTPITVTGDVEDRASLAGKWSGE